MQQFSFLLAVLKCLRELTAGSDIIISIKVLLQPHFMGRGGGEGIYLGRGSPYQTDANYSSALYIL